MFDYSLLQSQQSQAHRRRGWGLGSNGSYKKILNFISPGKCVPTIYIVHYLALQQLYYENRLKVLATQKEVGKKPYPHKFFVSLSIPEYENKYGSLDSGEHLDDVEVSLSGSSFISFTLSIYISLTFVIRWSLLSFLSLTPSASFCRPSY